MSRERDRANSSGYDHQALTRVAKLMEALLDERVPKRTRKKLQEWFRSSDSEEYKYDLLERVFEELEPNLTPDEFEYQQLLEIKQKLGMGSTIESHKPQPLKRGRTTAARWAMRVAAILLPIALIGSLYFWFSKTPLELYPETNVSVVADQTEVKEIELPDGSKVWINKGGEIAYGDDFLAERFLTINGEAYFKVAKNSEKPFRVKAKELIVEVTGTEFNLKSYEDEQAAEVVLVEGTVEVATLTKGKQQRYAMVAGEQLKMDKEGHIEVTELPKQEVAPEWRKPSLKFDNTPLREALQNVSTYFQKKILIENNVSHTVLINLQFDDEMTLEQIMELLEEMSAAFRYTIEEDTIIVRAR